jgi:hypothetical protein
VVCAHARRDFRRRRCRSLLDRTLVSPLAPREFLPNGKRRASPCRRASRQGIPRRHGYRSGPRSRPRASPDRITKRRPVLEDRSASFIHVLQQKASQILESEHDPPDAGDRVSERSGPSGDIDPDQKTQARVQVFLDSRPTPTGSASRYFHCCGGYCIVWACTTPTNTTTLPRPSDTLRS